MCAYEERGKDEATTESVQGLQDDYIEAKIRWTMFCMPQWNYGRITRWNLDYHMVLETVLTPLIRMDHESSHKCKYIAKLCTLPRAA